MKKTKITISRFCIKNDDYLDLKNWNYKTNLNRAEKAWEKIKIKYRVEENQLTYDCKNFFCTSESFVTSRGTTFKFQIDYNPI